MLYVPPVPWTRILLEGRTVFPLSCLKTVRDLKALKCVVGCSTVVDGNPWLGCGLTELLDTTVDVCLWLGGYFHTFVPYLGTPEYVPFCWVGVSYPSCRRFYEGAQSQAH